MAISLKHSFQSAVADSGDTTLVQPSNWNAEHSLTMATARLLGRTTAGTGSAEEISVGTGLSLSAGSLAVSSTTPQLNLANTFTASQIIEVTDNSNSALRITQLGTGNALLVEDSANPDSTPFIINASGSVGVGVTPVVKLQMYDATSSVFRVEGDATTLMQMYRYSTDANSSSIQLYKGRGTKASPSIISSGDFLGSIFAAGHNGSGDFNTITRIDYVADTVTSGTSMSSSIRFGTANAAATATERLRIGPAGQIGIGGATYGTSGQVLTSGGASAAPTWSNVGTTLIATLPTTSGTNPIASGLTLTSYKMLALVFDGVGQDSGASRQLLLGTSTADDLVINASENSPYRGIVWIDLVAGTATSSVGRLNAASSSAVNPYFADLAITSASTSISIALNNTGNFNAGSISIYGFS